MHSMTMPRSPSGPLSWSSAVCLLLVSCSFANGLDVANIFSFGDSYTSTGYTVALGPVAPDPGFTFADGPNWLEFLSEALPAATVRNLAFPGATIDPSVVEALGSLAFSQQVQNFSSTFSRDRFAWDPATTLFSIFIGINDVARTVYVGDATVRATLNSQLADRWSAAVVDLYNLGARNFLVLNVPALAGAPFALGLEVICDMATQSLNSAIRGAIANLGASLAGLNVFTADVYTGFQTWTGAPAGIGLTNVTSYCDAYSGLIFLQPPNQLAYDCSCSAPVGQYFWLDGLHPTFTVHRAIANLALRAISVDPSAAIPPASSPTASLSCSSVAITAPVSPPTSIVASGVPTSPVSVVTITVEPSASTCKASRAGRAMSGPSTPLLVSGLVVVVATMALH